MEKITFIKNMGNDAGSVVKDLTEKKKYQSRSIRTNKIDSNEALYPGLFSIRGSRVICSNTINRQTLLNKPTVSNVPDNDDQFFHNLMIKFEKNGLMQSSENNELNINQNTRLMRKKKPIFNEESENIMKRFKKEVEPRNLPKCKITPMQPHNIVKNVPQETNLSHSNCIENRNIFAPELFTTGLRKSTDNFLLKMTSKVQKDKCSAESKINKSKILETQIQEYMFYNLEYVYSDTMNGHKNSDPKKN